MAPRRIHADPPVFSLDIPETLLAPDAAFDWLGEDDCAVLRTLGNAQRRAQFACGRWLVRYAAHHAAGGDHRVRFAGRRPMLEIAGAPAAASISHSGRMVLCAAGRVAQLGVDVEEVRARSDWQGLAARVLHPEERERLALLPEALRWEGFYRAWTRKEALAKALGSGLALPFARIRISAAGRMEVEEGAGIQGIDPAEWRFSGLDPGPGLAGAVAWRERF